MSPPVQRTPRLIRGLLVAIAVLGLWAAWWSYPVENRFSLMRCTISFLGSPDADRNPTGWRFYQAGMTALVLLLFELAWLRHRRLRGVIGKAAQWSSSAVFLALGLIMLAVWIADTRDHRWFGMRTGALHTQMAILAIPLMAAGLVLDGVALSRAGLRRGALWPFPAFGGVIVVGAVALVAWEKKCAQDPALRHWPGDGIHSTPLWEWIVFICLIGFLAWMAHGRWSQHPDDSASLPR